MTIADEVKAEAHRGYAAWLAQPEVRLLLSMIPKTEPPELVQTVMRSAFEAGASAGMGAVMFKLVERFAPRT